MHAGQAVADELFRNIGEAIAIALLGLLGRIARSLTHAINAAHGAIRNAAIQAAIGKTIEGSARRIGRVAVDIRHFERFAVVEHGVPAAMMHRHRVILRDLIQVVNIDQPVILHLGVVEEESFNPRSVRRLRGFRAEFFHDARDGDEFNFIRIPDKDFVQQNIAGRVIVAIYEAGYDGHLLGVVRLRPLASKSFDFGGGADRSEAAGAERESLDPRRILVHGVNLRVEDDQVRFLRVRGRRGLEPRASEHPGESTGCQSKKFATAAMRHVTSRGLPPPFRAELCRPEPNTLGSRLQSPTLGVSPTSRQASSRHSTYGCLRQAICTLRIG